MRKILYLFLVTVLLTNCTDLDLEPHENLSPDVAYETLNDCNNAARGLYLKATSVYGDDYILIADVFCDNLISFSAGLHHYSEFRNWDMNASNSYMWLRPYACIVNCNLLINNIKEGDDFDPIKGEALALRAIMHFELAKQHGRAYIGATEADLGVPYISTTDCNNKPSRESLLSNFKNITDDLKAALDLMGDSKDVTRLNKSSINGYLSRVYLYMGEYDKSIAYAEEALKGNSLSDIADFHKIWTDESDAGVMLRLPIPNTSTLKVGDYFNQYMDNQYKSEFVAVKSFAELYDQENDIRFSAYLEKSFWKKQEAYHVIKYVGAGVDGHDRNQVGLKVMRVSEMYLNIAEASLRKSVKDETKANQMLSGLLTNRIEGYTHIDLSGDALLNEVMKQRRLELFCEWDRYSTLKRLSLGVHRVDEGENADGTGRKNLETTLESNDFRWLFPILISELDANANMRDQQNPGY